MTEMTGNTFNSGVNMDALDSVLQDTYARNMMGMRLINLSGTSFCVTNMRGTQEKFQLTEGFIPIASEEYNEVLYIISYRAASNEIEIGSYPSPDYSNTGQTNDAYRPFNNLNNGPFRTSAYEVSAKPRICDIEIQPDYDGSVNVVFTLTGKRPHVVNSKFRVVADDEANRTYQVVADRPGDVNSNTYTPASIAKETQLILYSDKILKINFGSISTGGRLKPGNYVYVFHYMTEDFATTDVIGQSSICQVAFGSDDNSLKGGNETEETGKRVALNLSNLDTDFKYLKIYILYSAGSETTNQQYLELTTPITISGETMTFIHNGTEETAEVPAEEVNIDYSSIDTATTITQIGRRLLVGAVTEQAIDYEDFRTASATVTPTFYTEEIPNGALSGYGNPANVYNKLSYFGNEAYPFAIVYIMPGGRISPVFPIKGRRFSSIISGGVPSITDIDQSNGVVTFPDSYHYLSVVSGKVQTKGVRFDVSTIPQEIRDASVGFFFVRGERNPWLIQQGIMVPTVRVPAIEYHRGDLDEEQWYYNLYNDEVANEGAYGFIPAPDGLVEAEELTEAGSSADPYYVVDDFFQVKDGYMPIYINDMRQQYGSTAIENYDTDAWALITGDGLVNEPESITNLLRDTTYVNQLAKVTALVRGAIDPKFDQASIPSKITGLHYDFGSLTRMQATSSSYRKTESIEYVPGELLARTPAGGFQSRVAFDLKWEGGDSARSYRVRQTYNAFFGVYMDDGLANNSKLVDNPYAGNTRMDTLYGGGNYSDGKHTSGVHVNNYNKTPNYAFLVNIYPTSARPLSTELYPNPDTISYRQVSPRFSWSDAVAAGNSITVYGGDCYVSKVSRRLNQSGYRNPTFAEGQWKHANINSGIVLTWWQESKYNLQLRSEILYDATETEKRSFFPYKTKGDVIEYRKIRYPETAAYTKGYSETLRPESFFALPDNAPFIQSDFFTRIYASDAHIPNAFRNGYRSFTGLNFQDYDTHMGRIIRILSHRNNLMVVFEHGVGVGPVNERIQTGSDAAGAIFVQPGQFLPPKLQYFSEEIGSQHFYSIWQTQHATYGMDAQKKVIWQVTDRMTLISDNGFASFLDKNPPVNPRTGYDGQYKEVVFTTNNWTIAFREFTNQMYFFPMTPSYYSSHKNKMLSFTDRFHEHGAPNYTLYGNEFESFVEFVVNKDLNLTKVFDWIQLISNEVAPKRIEFYTYFGVPEKSITINQGNCQQYARVDNVIDFFTQENNFEYRDKTWLIQIPNVQVYNTVNDQDMWEVDGRMRNTYMIVRVTYQTNKALELTSAITNFRHTVS
jgi:hypothetical protein